MTTARYQNVPVLAVEIFEHSDCLISLYSVLGYKQILSADLALIVLQAWSHTPRIFCFYIILSISVYLSTVS